MDSLRNLERILSNNELLEDPDDNPLAWALEEVKRDVEFLERDSEPWTRLVKLARLGAIVKIDSSGAVIQMPPEQHGRHYSVRVFDNETASAAIDAATEYVQRGKNE